MKLYPMWSSHGHGRKTHIVDENDGSFCGIEKRMPGLLFDIGDEIVGSVEEWAGYNVENNCCKRCLAAATAPTPPSVPERGREGSV